jgi:tryptophanase
VDYLAEVILAVKDQRSAVRGHRIVWQAPVLRHFTARLEPVG